MCILCGNSGHAIGPWEIMVGSAAVYGVYDTVLQPMKRRLFGSKAAVAAESDGSLGDDASTPSEKARVKEAAATL